MKQHQTMGLPAAIYVRISADLAGEGLGVERQAEDATALAAALGCPVVRVYRDNDISASTTSQKVRPEYAAMIEAVRSGQVKVIVAYSNSRLTRRPRELEDLIDLHRETGVIIKTVVSGDDDLSTADGRMVARIKANVDAAEAERTSERVKRQKQQRLASGKPPASRWRTFGFTGLARKVTEDKDGNPIPPRWDEHNYRGKGWEVIPEEADIVREVFKRVGGGESLNSVTKDLRSRGAKRVSGELWTYQATLRMVDSRIYAGFLSYKGQKAGKANVEVLVAEDLWNAANGRKRRPTGRVGKVNRKSLLGGIAVCDACKAPMTASGGPENRYYVCDRRAGGCGNVRHKREWLDDLVEANIWQVLAHDYRAKEDKPKVDTRAQVATLDALIKKIQDDITSLRIPYEDGGPMLVDLRAKRKALAEASAPDPDSFHKVLTDFKTADIATQSAEVRRHVSAIVVRPTPKRGNTKFDPSRFDVVLKSGEVVPGPEFVAEGFSRVVRVFAKTA